MRKTSLSSVFIALAFLSLAMSVANAQSVSAYQLWQKPSFFRGFNLSYNPPISQQDLFNLKASGANIVYISSEGFRDMDSPYAELPNNVADLDIRIHYADSAGVRYAIAVRRGPGRGDAYLQGVGLDPPSTVWENKNEQQLYGSMLREITARYASDTLFVGITPTVEPNMGSDVGCCLDTTLMLQYFADNGINFNAIMQLWVDSIRVGSKTVPVLIQGPGFSNPDLFSLVPIVNDPYAVYEFHSYRPQIYCDEGAKDSSEVYPGRYLNYQSLTYDTFNKAFIDDSVYDYVKRIEKETGAPIFMGEFGLETRQIGGVQFITDISSIAIENGLSFAYWFWHTGYDTLWTPKLWGGDYWAAVLASLDQGNSGVTESSPKAEGLMVSQSPDRAELSVYWPVIDQSGLPAHVSIFDMLGRPVLSCDENSSRFLLDLSELSNGVYIISIHSGQATAHALVSDMR